MQESKHIKAIIVGIISAFVAILVFKLNLNTWLSAIIIAIIVFIVATIIDKYKSN